MEALLKFLMNLLLAARKISPLGPFMLLKMTNPKVRIQRRVRRFRVKKTRISRMHSDRASLSKLQEEGTRLRIFPTKTNKMSTKNKLSHRCHQQETSAWPTTTTSTTAS
jgi:hypothetical protein